MIVAYLTMTMTFISTAVTAIALRSRLKQHVALTTMAIMTGQTRPHSTKYVLIGVAAFHVWFVLWWLMFDGIF